MKDLNKLDGFLDTALWILGAGIVWSIPYFGTAIMSNTLMLAIPVLLITVVIASAVFVAAFIISRGFPLSEAEADDRTSERWDDEKQRAFRDSYPKRKKAARRLALISFGMLIPVAADLVMLYLL